MRRAVFLIAVFLRNSIQVEMEYRANLLASALTSVLSCAMAIMTLLAFFDQTDRVGGWTLPMMIGLFGVTLILEGLIDSWLFPSLNAVSEYVRRGDLDLLLIRPVNSQFIVSFRHLRIWYGPNILLGFGAVLYSMAAQETLTAANVILFLLLTVSGATILYSIWLAASTLSFWFTKVGEVSIIAYTLMEAGRFPVTAYPAWARFALTFVIPIAFITNVPAEAAMGQLTWERGLLGLAAGLVALCLGSLFWRFGLSRYSSASS
jgi:ABC-2 type transport system permease protein